MQEFLINLCEGIKDMILFIPRKIAMHIDNYNYLEGKYREYILYKKLVERRLHCIQITAEQNHYLNEEVYKRKIVELTTTPIEFDSTNLK